jgi:hypothetical protein
MSIAFEIIWPDGKYQLIKNVNANQVLKVDYAKASVRTIKMRVHRLRYSLRLIVVGPEFHPYRDTFVDFKLQPTMPHMHSRSGPGVAVGDVNADGKEDFMLEERWVIRCDVYPISKRKI